MGDGGNLNLVTGEMTVPSLADTELYLMEVSAKWLLEKAHEGIIKNCTANMDEASAAVLNGGGLPEVESSEFRMRCSALLALAADGISHINHANRIDRGYEHIVQKLTNLGASMKRVNIEEYSEEDTEA